MKVAGLTEDAAEQRVDIMAGHFPDAMIPVDPDRVAELTNHPKDRHVLAVAIEAGAPVIVTQNVRDFPPSALSPYHVEPWTADEFLLHLFEENPAEMVQAVRYHASRLRNPPMTPGALLDRLTLHAPTFAAETRALIEYNT